MGQIVKRKKKGRPSKADLAAEKKALKSAKSQPAERELRRSARRRSSRYTLYFDDYLDDDEFFFDEDEEEDERRREKKLKLLLKLHGAADGAPTTNDSPRPRRVDRHAPSASSSSGSDDDDNPSKKRRVDGGSVEEDEDYENDDAEDDDTNINSNYDYDVEVKRGNGEATKEVDSAPGSPSSGIPLPDKKTLEFILDKLQKKDIYGVYAEPVDPEELPDYHDVIEHPMDFSTIRKKLADGLYATLEQFESDVFLLCSNAMQYNAPDTIYYKQARSIQELAKKKIDKLRIAHEPAEKELKSELKPKPMPIVKKPLRKSLSRTLLEPVGSDFSSGATRASAGDFPNCSNAMEVSGTEKPNTLDGLIEGNASILDTSLDKVEEPLPGKGLITRFGRKMSVHDDNRRGTYDISTESVASPGSVFSTFSGEDKQLIPVGLYVDFSYARSLARFAGSLGSVAWNIASKRIEQVVPQGTKFGRGWVGEYEPLPTPVLMLENCTIKEPNFLMKPRETHDARTDKKSAPVASKCIIKEPAFLMKPQQTHTGKEELFVAPVALKDVTGPTRGVKFPFFRPSGVEAATSSSSTVPPPAKEAFFRVTNTAERPSYFFSPGSTTAVTENFRMPQNSHSRNFVEPENKILNPVELNSLPSTDRSTVHQASERQVSSGTESFRTPQTPQNLHSRNFMESETKTLKPVELISLPSTDRTTVKSVSERQVSNSTEVLTPRSVEMVSMKRSLGPCRSFKQSNASESVGGPPNGRHIRNSSNDNGAVGSSSDVGQGTTYLPRGQDQALTDPVQLMKMLTAKNQNQQKSALPGANAAAFPSPVQSLSREDSGNASATAARAWMSLGAGGFRPGETMSFHKNHISAESLYNPSRELQQLQASRFRGDAPSAAVHFQPDKNSFPLHAFVPQPAGMNNLTQFQNRPMVFPQLGTADLSRFQMQSPWRSVSPQTQQIHNPETLPPDLNISFQSSGSPGRPSSGVLVDSQQPDLALQL